MDPALLIAQSEHGPQIHGPALAALAVFVLVAAVVSLVRKGLARRRSDRDRGGPRSR